MSMLSLGPPMLIPPTSCGVTVEGRAHEDPPVGLATQNVDAPGISETGHLGPGRVQLLEIGPLLHPETRFRHLVLELGVGDEEVGPGLAGRQRVVPLGLLLDRHVLETVGVNRHLFVGRRRFLRGKAPGDRQGNDQRMHHFADGTSFRSHKGSIGPTRTTV